MASSGPIIELANARKYYAVRGRGWLGSRRAWVKAVDGVSLSIGGGRTLGVVGESGCGKSTTIRLILGVESPTGGEVRFEGRALGALEGEAWRGYRRSVQAVFQDPWGSLNPRMRVGMIVAEPLIVTKTLPRTEALAAVAGLLLQVGLQPSHADRFPHEFSGGQRQRIAVARALALSPRLVVLDEPVSALDVSIRAQIINLLKDLQEERGLAYLFVAHQLSSVWSISDDVAVMYLGRIVEHGSTDAVRNQPLHPYTQALLRAALPAHPRERRSGQTIAGEVPSPIDPPAGCHFHPRCPMATKQCAELAPSLREVGGGRSVACHLY